MKQILFGVVLCCLGVTLPADEPTEPGPATAV